MRVHRQLFTTYLRLRAIVYIDQTHYLNENRRREDGTEIDNDDKRSVHIVAMENRRSHAVVVGPIRLITKTQEDNEPLPSEEFFGLHRLPIGTIEVSRYSTRLDDRSSVAQVRNNLFLTGLAYIYNNNLSPTVAVVNSELEEKLRQNGVPLKRISDTKFVDEYNTPNFAIEIDVNKFANLMGGATAIQRIDTTPGGSTYWGGVEIR